MNDLRRYLVDEFVEDYEQGRITRREALKLLSGLTGAALATRILEAHAQTPSSSASAAGASSGAPANRVRADDPAVVAATIQFPGDAGKLFGYQARPAGSGAYPIVLVCHENRGLTPHIEDVTRRVAKAGYVGLAVDLVSREGGTASIAQADRIPATLGGAPPARHVQDFQSGFNYLRAQPFARGERIGIVGFCFGGSVVWRVAAAIPQVSAAVPFYGLPVQAGEVPKINAAVLAIYAGRDERINQNIPAIESAMQHNGKTFRKIVYPDVYHAFHNDTGERYNAEAAAAAWKETLAWFERYLKT